MLGFLGFTAVVLWGLIISIYGQDNRNAKLLPVYTGTLSLNLMLSYFVTEKEVLLFIKEKLIYFHSIIMRGASVDPAADERRVWKLFLKHSNKHYDDLMASETDENFGNINIKNTYGLSSCMLHGLQNIESSSSTLRTTTSITSTAAACNSRCAREGRDTSQSVCLHPLITICLPSPRANTGKREKKN